MLNFSMRFRWMNDPGILGIVALESQLCVIVEVVWMGRYVCFSTTCTVASLFGSVKQSS